MTLQTVRDMLGGTLSRLRAIQGAIKASRPLLARFSLRSRRGLTLVERGRTFISARPVSLVRTDSLGW
jgi:sensor domain CHASE-containing protein